jgi:hypothetical protein
VESGNTQELHIKVGDQSQTIDIHQVQAIQFGVSLPAPAAAPPPPNAADLAPAASEPAPAAVPPTLNAGASAAIGAAASAGATSRSGAVAGAFAGKPTGKKIAPETRFTKTLTQPAVINSERGR